MKKTKEKTTENEFEAEKLRYSVSGGNFFKHLSVLLLFVAMILILLSNWGFWHDLDMTNVYLQIILPIAGCMLFIIVVNHMGEKGFVLSFIPVVLLAAYVIINEADKGAPLHSILSIALCTVVTLSYILTVFGAISSKWMMLPITLFPLAYRIIVEDIDMFAADGFTVDPAFLQELAILCMIAALLFIVFAMKKREKPRKEKPIEEVLVELEDVPADGIDNEDTLQPEMQDIPCLADADTVVIVPSGEKGHE